MWQDNQITINKIRSAIHQIKIERRTPNEKIEHIINLPVKENFKYFGIISQENLKINLNIGLKDRTGY